MILRVFSSIIIVLLFVLIPYTHVYNQRQLTNVFIRGIQSNRLIYSSLNGSVIINSIFFNLLMTRERNHGNENIQSNYFEDEMGCVWFSTYEALHVYIPEKDDFEYQQMVSRRGDTIRSDYKVIGLDGVDLYFKAGDEFFLYDVCLRQVIKSWSVPIRESHDAVIQEDADGMKLYYSIEDTLYWKNLNLAEDQIHLVTIDNRVRFILNSKSSILYLGMNDGRLLY